MGEAFEPLLRILTLQPTNFHVLFAFSKALLQHVYSGIHLLKISGENQIYFNSLMHIAPLKNVLGKYF